MSVTLEKVAWVRDPGQPIGQPGTGRLRCPCGQAPPSSHREEDGDVHCPCGRVFSYNGWLRSENLLRIEPASEWAWDSCKADYHDRANIWRECTAEFAEHTLNELPPLDWRDDPYRFLCMETYAHAEGLEWYLAIVRVGPLYFCRIVPRPQFDTLAKLLVRHLQRDPSVWIDGITLGPAQSVLK